MPIVRVTDFEPIARDKLPGPIYDFIAGGAEDEVSLARNREAWQRILLRPRMLVDVTNVDTSTELLGERVSYPLMLAPVAFHKLSDRDGELATARAVTAAGTGMILSTMSTCTVEDVAGAADCPKWFQLYVNPDREVTRGIVERARACGFKGLCLTVDVPYLGRRERDFKNALQFPQDIVPANFATPAYEAANSALTAQAATIMDPSVTWRDVAWLREVSGLPVMVKGILTAEDAVLAVEHGCAGVVVSNHGARQLDGVPAPIEVLPEIAEAVGGRIPLLVDGGVRRGTDILKAVALGADAVLIGRPYIWGLAAKGEKGVRMVLEMLREEFRLAMALCGVTSVDQITPALVRR
jgi:isopentenyl diphosphate isomerase/L-lactate dehydrogenase-like FMN-dependent dehydrogenase